MWQTATNHLRQQAANVTNTMAASGNDEPRQCSAIAMAETPRRGCHDLEVSFRQSANMGMRRRDEPGSGIEECQNKAHLTLSRPRLTKETARATG